MKYMNNHYGYCQIFHAPDSGADGGDDAGAAGGNGDGAGGDGRTTGGSGEEQQPTFDDLLKGGHQAEFDRGYRRLLTAPSQRHRRSGRHLLTISYPKLRNWQR